MTGVQPCALPICIQHNDAAETEDGLSLRVAAERSLSRQTDELQKFSNSSAPTSVALPATFTQVFLVDARRNAAVSGLDRLGAAAEYQRFASALKQSVASMLADAPKPRQLFMVAENTGYAVSIVRSPPKTPVDTGAAVERPLAYVGVRAIDTDYLNRLASVAGIGALGIVSEPSGNPALSAIAIENEGHAAFLEWRADRPGDRLVGQIGTMLVSFAALFAGLLC